ncbi:MAG: hypothetical protein ACTSR3_07715, partial [Candidatus Helarchaeota archaeon]
MEKFRDLTHIEQDILKIATEIVNKNKILKLKTLYEVAKSNLNYRNEEVSRGIYNLVLKKIIFS